MKRNKNKKLNDDIIYQGTLPEMTIIADKNSGEIYKNNTPHISINKEDFYKRNKGEGYFHNGMNKFWKESPIKPEDVAFAFLPDVVEAGVRVASKPIGKVISKVLSKNKYVLNDKNAYKVVRGGLFHDDYLNGNNPLSVKPNPDKIYAVLEDVVKSSNRESYAKWIPKENKQNIKILGKDKGYTNIAELYQKKSDKDINLFTNGSHWADLKINSPEKQLNIYKNNIENYKNYKGHLSEENLNKYIKYIENNINNLNQQYNKFINKTNKYKLDLNDLITDDLSKIMDDDDVGNILFRDIYDAHTGDEIIMNTKIAHPKSIYGGNKIKDITVRNPLLSIPLIYQINKKDDMKKLGGSTKYKIEAEGGEIIQSDKPIEIKKGGIAIPLGNGFSLLQGNTHKQGGIDIDLKGNGKVWSDVPFLNGESPAKKVLDGEDPNLVFKEQELYKQMNKIKDNGNKAEMGEEVKTEQKRTKPRKINLEGITTTRNRPYNLENTIRIANSLDTVPYLNDMQRSVILANIIEESGSDPYAIDKTKDYTGLLQWEDSRRYSKKTGNVNKDIDNQLNNEIYATINNTTDKKSWTHGGKGSGYKTAKGAYKVWTNAKTIEDATHSFTRGYVRPRDGNESVKNRTKVAEQIYERYNNAKESENKTSVTDRIIKFLGLKEYGGTISNDAFMYNINGNVKQGSRFVPSTGKRVKAKNGLLVEDLSEGIKEALNTNPTTWDYISIASNALGSLRSYFINKNMINKLKEPLAPVAPALEQAVKLNTTYNINPQLDLLKQSENNAYKDIAENTNSSNVALSRRQNVRLNNLLQRASLYGEKFNIENQLINQDLINKQSVSSRNIQNYNQYLTDKYKHNLAINEFNNKRKEMLSEVDNSLINNLSNIVMDNVTRTEKRRQDKNTLLASFLKSPEALKIFNIK